MVEFITERDGVLSVSEKDDSEPTRSAPATGLATFTAPAQQRL